MFTPGHQPQAEDDQGFFVVLSEGQILCSNDDTWAPLAESAWRLANPQPQAPSYCLGVYRGRDCYAIILEGCPEIQGYHWIDLRRLMHSIDDIHYQISARALQIHQWRQDHQFCGRCGQATASHEKEMARHCKACNLYFYPRLSPCVIMLVTRGQQCLLARNAKFPANFYSALAGFIEVGETVELALQREVREEVGLEVGKMTYFGSQAWPFPSQLMIGFHAEYVSGTIEVDGVEIEEADWFHYSELPPVPAESTLSGRLISHFVNRCLATR